MCGNIVSNLLWVCQPTAMISLRERHAGFHLEIVPRGGEAIVFYHKGARKRLAS